MNPRAILLFFACLTPVIVTGKVLLPAIISDHMVLARSEKAAVWGWAEPGEAVEVSISATDAAARTSAGSDGHWRVTLDTRQIGDGPFELHVSRSDGAENQIVVRDVVIGEVWVAGGQSNMELPLKRTAGAKDEIARASNPSLRQFKVGRKAMREKQDDCLGRWTLAAAETAGDFSAVGYYFGKRLQAELGAPVGIISCNWSATHAEVWISREALDSNPALKAGREQTWDAMDATLAGKPGGARPAEPQHTGAYLFNGMVYPLIGYSVRGFIWYQGESNAGRAWQYRTTFPLLISDWRRHWRTGGKGGNAAGGGALPFYFFQLANYYGKETVPAESAWAELREAQSLTAATVPDTAQAVLIDSGEPADIHPVNKRVAGERLARIALARDYDRPVVWSGPVYDSMKVEGSRIRLRFTHADGGLVAQPVPETYIVRATANETAPLVRNNPGSQLEGFAICGEDRQWHWADAKIEGDGESASVVVQSPAVPAPVAVRYAWANNPNGNLYNGASLPASPFRTDDFPALTRNRHY